MDAFLIIRVRMSSLLLPLWVHEHYVRMFYQHHGQHAAGENVEVRYLFFGVRMPHEEESAVRVEPAFARRQGAQRAQEGAAAVELAEGEFELARQNHREGLAVVGLVLPRLQQHSGRGACGPYFPVRAGVAVQVPAELLAGPGEDGG